MLDGVQGFFPRLIAHIKYTLMRQHRPWTMDDALALFSWIFMSNAAFILVGTTTFASILLALANSLQFQEFIAQQVGDYLTRETGIQFVFESAIVPNWNGGKIRLRNVVLSRGPQRRLPAEATDETPSAAPDDEANMLPGERELDQETSLGIVVASPLEGIPLDVAQLDEEEWDTNLTMFRVTVDQIEITLNMMRWFDGKGLVENCSIKGVRGVIDRTHVYWDPDVTYIPAENRHPARPGDFELERFAVEDVLVTVMQPGGFRPYQMSILSAVAPRLRKRWLIYDLICAESIVGKFDDCLFSVHQAQHQGPPSSAAPQKADGKQPCTRTSEFRIDGVNIDHLNAGVAGPFGWITSASVDISAHMTFPMELEDDALSQLIGELVERVDAATAARRHTGTFHDDLAASITGREVTAEGHNDSPSSVPPEHTAAADPLDASEPVQKLIVDLGVRFNNVKASVPLIADDLSYINNALVRPVVAYMNWHRTCIPVQCTIAMDLQEFDGSWTLYEADLVDTISEGVGRALVQLATDERERNRRLKRVGLWGLQSVTRNLISVIDYGRGAKGFWEYAGLSGNS
ncbi:mitochondrial distribution and morphology protein family 31/32 [Thamnocephalis sphaerospora]|uniref:Mitochondrial distribution and morphology protein family 31/32 n=1 Tax=Thamnocephalis sphaerospora TaxID=78915 RepID=A0A4P9XXZ5_9FUNG|nr:mitochondrial distribution and morphology protein family 31/32 [Thamnocephalis sphaerospora]|eukprot:RKP11204.1 mitochondrial distribution and morphology protein family 31/32 [Thamnocephalis sphaerospora]